MGMKTVRIGPLTGTGSSGVFTIPETRSPIAVHVHDDGITSFTLDVMGTIFPFEVDGVAAVYDPLEEDVESAGYYGLYLPTAALRIDVSAINVTGGTGVWVDLLYYEETE